MEIYIGYNTDVYPFIDGAELIQNELEVDFKTLKPFNPDALSCDALSCIEEIVGLDQLRDDAMIGNRDFSFNHNFNNGILKFSCNIDKVWSEVKSKILELSGRYYLSIVTNHVGGHSGYAPFIFRCIIENKEIINRLYSPTCQDISPDGNFRIIPLSEVINSVETCVKRLDIGHYDWESSLMVIISNVNYNFVKQGDNIQKE